MKCQVIPGFLLVVAAVWTWPSWAPALAREVEKDPRAVVVEADMPSPTFRVDLEVDRLDRLYKRGDLVNVKVRSEKAGYLYLLYADASKKAYLLFPNNYQADNRIPAGETIAVPQPQSGFRLRVGPPYGWEVLAAVVTTRPLSISPHTDNQRANFTELTSDQVREVLCQCQKSDVSPTSGDWGGQRLTIRTYARGNPSAEAPAPLQPPPAPQPTPCKVEVVKSWDDPPTPQLGQVFTVFAQVKSSCDQDTLVEVNLRFTNGVAGLYHDQATKRIQVPARQTVTVQWRARRYSANAGDVVVIAGVVQIINREE